MAAPATTSQSMLSVLMKGFTYDNAYWRQKPPSGLLRASPNAHGYQTFFDVINPGIADFLAAVASDQALLSQRTWAVSFAEDYIKQLENQAAGSSSTTTDLTTRRATLVSMQSAVLRATTRLSASQALLAEFQLCHRLLTSISGRIKPSVTAAERLAIDRGLGMLDTQWAKLQDLLPAPAAAKTADSAAPSPVFAYNYHLQSPSGAKTLESADACDGPLVLPAGYTAGEALLGKKKKNKKRKKANTGAAGGLAAEHRFFAGRVFSDDGILALDTEVVRAFSHDHKRDYWGCGARRRGASF